jgi:hypothetical protein
MVFNDVCYGMFTGIQQPSSTPLVQPQSATSTLFGGDIPAVHFNAVTPMATPHFERMFYPVQTSPLWKSPVFQPVVGSRLNVQG